MSTQFLKDVKINDNFDTIEKLFKKINMNLYYKKYI